jgi:LmbE family N-acetylglucosaminyl deacetylase
MNNAIANFSPLAQPLGLPIYSVRHIAEEPVLVVAPHPDDETLGCGGAIALLKSQGFTVRILVVSDGTKSHPNSVKYPAPILKNLRETETFKAMATLGIESPHITFLQLPDGAIPESGELFQATVNVCRAYLESVSPKIIFVPYRADPHPDHRATWQIIDTSLKQTVFASRIIEYPIWDWDLQQRGLLPQNSHHAWRLDIKEVVKLKQIAIAAYHSQTTNLIDDDPTGFRLSEEMLKNFTQPWEVYLEEN